MSYTAVPTVATGDPWSAANHNTYIRDNFAWLFENLFPVGAIAIWSGSIASIPSNWHLCDGTNGTPDLRNRFVIGAGSTYAVNATGGSTTKNLAHTHTQGNTGSESSHTHTQGNTGPESAHTHLVSGETESDGAYASPHIEISSDYIRSVNTHTHKHTVNITSAPGSSHSHTNPTTNAGSAHSHTNPTTDSALSATQDIMPPYYALAYIMRIS